MNFAIDVKIKAGKRIKTEIYVEPRSINQREVNFKNGLCMTNYEIAQFIKDMLIKKFGNNKNETT